MCRCFPAMNAAKAIIQSGIKEVIYVSNKYEGTPSVQASRKCLTRPGYGIISITLDRAEDRGRIVGE